VQLSNELGRSKIEADGGQEKMSRSGLTINPPISSTTTAARLTSMPLFDYSTCQKDK